MSAKTKPCQIVVLIGGNGSNLQALIDQQPSRSAYQIAGVISHREKAYGLERAARAGVPTTVVPHTAYEDRVAFEQALIKALDNYQPDLIVLAGFMRILSPEFVNHYPGKILNIHPSLLPKYKGLNTHQRVLDAKDQEHGVSVHFVTDELDGGPLIAQMKVPVLKNDNAESLAERVHHAEHWLYPTVVEWFAEERLKCQGSVVTLDNERLDKQGRELTLTSEQGMAR